MPKAFEDCVKAGGKVITKKLGDGKYVKMCKTKGGKWVRGHVAKKRAKK